MLQLHTWQFISSFTCIFVSYPQTMFILGRGKILQIRWAISFSSGRLLSLKYRPLWFFFILFLVSGALNTSLCPNGEYKIDFAKLGRSIIIFVCRFSKFAKSLLPHAREKQVSVVKYLDACWKYWGMLIM